ncbi:MAG: 5-formyltetrahydrofolate cyclo-ligase [Gammaproteobacteria bacterium]|nr:5-formyltetrahydrofolate cyclo-ligase [Gammaproteobacteria bacterium]|tara:strand:+ start:3722 stop:4342 length:621 start_codon:yes stop_codon:yes gene_type:complete
MSNKHLKDSKHLQIRKKIRQLRRSIPPQAQADAARSVCSAILQDPDFQAAQSLAFYQAFDGEIDPQLLMQEALQAGKNCYLPVLDKNLPQLLFAQYQPDTKLLANKFGITEPPLYPNNTLSPENLDIIFLPLVAFDTAGTRLGMGQGFYDRTLATVHREAGDNSGKTPKLIGLGHECQRVERLERAEWDVPLDMIVTDQTVYRVDP